jgi:hypothetical protein
MEEAFRYGLLAHQLLNQRTPYPPLAPAGAWARAQGYRQLQVSLALLAAENLAVLGETAQADNLLSAASSSAARSDLPISQVGARSDHLAALIAYQAGNVEAGDRALTSALAFGRKASTWLFQIHLADQRYTSGQYSDRVGTALYETLLRDPTPGDWAYSPLECLSVLTTPHEGVLEHWFEAVLQNAREQELALEIADRVRRHRFYSTLPLGGRLLALRWILEGPPELLGERGILERQELLARYPAYQQLAQKAAAAHTKLATIPLVSDDANVRAEQGGQLGLLADLARQQEMLLRQMAVRREAADFVFPPLRKTADVQKSLPEGQVLMAFFRTSRHLYGFLYSKDQYASWRIQSPAPLQKQVSLLLRELGNYDVNHELTRNELEKDAWRGAGDRVLELLLARSNVSLTGNFDEIVIVPDGFLWYLPFEALSVGKPGERRLLISRTRVRYAPTVGLAVGSPRVKKPRPNVGVVLGKLFPQDDPSAAQGAFEQFGPAVAGAVALPQTLPVASGVYRTVLDGLIVLDDVEPTSGPFDWSPLQVDRGPGASLDAWLALPWGAPDHVVLPGFHTPAETGLRKGAATGDDLFLATCGLMTAGVRTILISRWRAAGQTSFDLVREFVQELPHATPAEAWQRSVQIAADTPLDVPREPRVQQSLASEQPPKANHPFFWAGYMLVDSGENAVTPEQGPLGLGANPGNAPGAAPGAAPPADAGAKVNGAAPAAGGAPGANALLPAGIGQPAVDAPVDAPAAAPKSKAAKAKTAPRTGGGKSPRPKAAKPPAAG